jgi:hypothetical protein
MSRLSRLSQDTNTVGRLSFDDGKKMAPLAVSYDVGIKDKAVDQSNSHCHVEG